MTLKSLKERLKKGVFTQKEYDTILNTMKLSEDQLIGIVPDITNFEQRWAMGYDVKNGSLVEYIKKMIVPWLGAENYDEVFKKYGMTICGIGDSWYWFTNDNITEEALNQGHKPIEEATELELWKIIALCQAYWCGHYEEWYDNMKNRIMMAELK